MVRSILCALAFGVVLFGVAGCSNDRKDDAAVKSLSADDAAKLNSERSSSWEGEDPPLTAATHFAAGQLAEAQGDLPRAITQYQKALSVDPKLSIAQYRMGVVYSQMRAFPDAIDAWKKYARMTDNSAEAFSNLGFCYEISGDKNSAANVYNEGIAKFPTHQGLRVNYGLMLARSGDLDGAKKQLSLVLSEAQVHYNLGSLYEQQGRKELARQEYIASIQADPNFIDARSRLATLDQN